MPVPTPESRRRYMASTAERLRKLVSENVEVDGKSLDIPADLNFSLADAGVSSLDLVALGKLVAEEFKITFAIEDCTSITDLAQLADFIDAKAA